MLISSRTVYPTKHGIPTTVSPKIVQSPNLNIKRIDKWMLDNALSISAKTDEFMHIQFKGMNLKNMSQADRDALNIFLWDDEGWND